MNGKRSQDSTEIKRLKDTILQKEKEVKEIKFSVSDILMQIRNVNESNNYSDPSVRKRKISKLCTDTIYQHLIDEIEDNNEKAKIIELPNTNQSNK